MDLHYEENLLTLSYALKATNIILNPHGDMVNRTKPKPRKTNFINPIHNELMPKPSIGKYTGT